MQTDPKEELTVTKHLILLLTAALLVFSLTACGCSAKDSGTTTDQQTTGTTQDSTSPNTGTSNGDAGLGTGTNPDSAVPGSDTGRTLMDDAKRAANNGVRDTKNALDDVASELGGTGFRQMVRNGRVHDTDGDLTDGENSRSYGKLF